LKRKDYPETKAKTVKETKEAKIQDPADHYESIPQNLDELLLDSHGHLIVKHDLFNHDGLTKDGIAEAFLEFAKREKLSFVGK
jgi:type I restriction enzyme M protein